MTTRPPGAGDNAGNTQRWRIIEIGVGPATTDVWFAGNSMTVPEAGLPGS